MATATEKLMFKSAPVVAVPPKYCVGRVSEISEVKETEKKTYLMIQFKIQPIGPGQATQSQFMFRPEWLSTSFDPAAEFDTKTQEGRSANFVYNNNIRGEEAAKGQDERPSILAGLAGSQARFEELAGLLLSNPIDPTADGYVESVEQIIQDFCFPGGAPAIDPETDEPYVIGYRLTQRKDKAEDGGKPILRSGLNFDSFWYPTDAAVEKLRKRAEDKGDIEVAF
jgi:hypothetical protein